MQGDAVREHNSDCLARLSVGSSHTNYVNKIFKFEIVVHVADAGSRAAVCSEISVCLTRQLLMSSMPCPTAMVAWVLGTRVHMHPKHTVLYVM